MGVGFEDAALNLLHFGEFRAPNVNPSSSSGPMIRLLGFDWCIHPRRIQYSGFEFATFTINFESLLVSQCL